MGEERQVAGVAVWQGLSWYRSLEGGSRDAAVAYVTNLLQARTTPHPETSAARLAELIVTVVMCRLGADLATATGTAANAAGRRYLTPGPTYTVVEAPDVPPQVVCTGLTAGWCPRCGTCRCASREDGYGPSLNDPGCPLHAPGSAHAESNRSDISLWAHCDDDGCPLRHERDPEGVRRHQLPDDHPIVVSLRASGRRA